MKDQKAILFFLLKFVGLYLILNTSYSLWIAHYEPQPDPLTIVVTDQTVFLISLFEDNVAIGASTNSPHVPVLNNGRTVIRVFEGCNGLNVMIVFISFIVAFTGTLRKTVLFSIAGFLLIYIFNLFRVGLLYFIAKYYPDNLYFFHKYLFTGLLYVLVFLLWYFWVSKIWPKKT